MPWMSGCPSARRRGVHVFDDAFDDGFGAWPAVIGVSHASAIATVRMTMMTNDRLLTWTSLPAGAVTASGDRADRVPATRPSSAAVPRTRGTHSQVFERSSPVADTAA